MTQRLVLIAFVCALACACSLEPPVKAWKHNYALRPMPAPARGAATRTAPIRATLRVAALDAPGWLMSRDMYYQLYYSSPDTVSAYSESRWLAPPSVMLGHLVLQGLSDAARWTAVIGPGNDARADYTLRLRLTEFQQIFKDRKRSYGLLLARGTLVDARHDSVVGQHTFRFEVEAPSADSQGGARALSKASHDLVIAVRQWLTRVMAE